MQGPVKTLSMVADRYAPSRAISFDISHVFKAMQLMAGRGKTSRAALVSELRLGEGSVRTLVRHLKLYGLVSTSNGGMRMSEAGRGLYGRLSELIAGEMDVRRCSSTPGRFNHAVLIRGAAPQIGSGLEQHDWAVRAGAVGATTLLFEAGRLLMPGQSGGPRGDAGVHGEMIRAMGPADSDVVVIVGADDQRTAELAAKSVALMTVADRYGE